MTEVGEESNGGPGVVTDDVARTGTSGGQKVPSRDTTDGTGTGTGEAAGGE